MKCSLFTFARYIFLLSLCIFLSLNNGSALNLKVASVNIRLDTKKDSLNPWRIRKILLFEYVKNQKIDVLCLQECCKNQLSDFKTAFSGYSVVSISSRKRQCLNVPILYSTKKFDCMKSGTFWLSEHPDTKGKGWDAASSRLVTWARLKDKQTGKVLFVFNTHLDNIGKIARIESMKLIKSYMNAIANGFPILLAGDMNSTPKSMTYKLAIADKVPMFDAYKVASKKTGVGYTFHKYGLSCTMRLDYVFVSDSIRVDNITIPKEKKVKGCFMSDHNPVVVTISL